MAADNLRLQWPATARQTLSRKLLPFLFLFLFLFLCSFLFSSYSLFVCFLFSATVLAALIILTVLAIILTLLTALAVLPLREASGRKLPGAGLEHARVRSPLAAWAAMP